MEKKKNGRKKYKNADFKASPSSAAKKSSAKGTSGTSGAKGTTGTATKKSTSSKAKTSGKTDTQSEKEKILSDLHMTTSSDHTKFYTVLFFSLSVLMLILIFFPGTSGWNAIHKCIRGLFGISILVFPFGFLWIVYKLDLSLKKSEPKYKSVDIKIELVKILGIALVLSGFGQTMFGQIRTDHAFTKVFSELYNSGMTFKSAGAMSSLLAYPLVKLLGKYGAKIVIIFIAFIVLMWVSGCSIGQFFNFIFHPVSTIDNILEKNQEEQAPEPDTDEWRSISDTGEIPSVKDYLDNINNQNNQNSPAKPVKKDKNAGIIKHNGVDFMMDVPLEDESEFVPGEPTPSYDKIVSNQEEKVVDFPKTQKKTESDTSNSAPKATAADSLEEMIKKATQEPESKKLKQQEKKDMMLSVNEEFRQRQGTYADGYEMPSLDFLNYAEHKQKDQTELREKGRILQETFSSFGVNASIEDITMGPTVIRYEVKPAPGVKVSKVTNLADDIALNLAASGVRIEAPIPGKSAIGIEVPNDNRDIVSLRELLESDKFLNAKSKLAFAVGRDISGDVIIGDIAKMPHVIIAGSTGSGKSVCTNSIIMSILYHASPEEVKLILIDPKIVEFRVYDGIPHLLIPVVTDPKKAAGALNWAVQEMLRRYQVFAQTGVRDLADYNEWCKEEANQSEPMPQIVICIDELADLMMAASKEVEDAICRLAQMARAAGMHLIIATQRPTTDIITGLIKANVPSRIALSVMSSVDSRTILDTGGAEKLLGHGDMLYFPSSYPKPVRVQGCFVSTKEIEKAVEFIKSQTPTDYNQEIMQAVEESVPVLKGEKNSGSSADGDYSSDDTELINRAIDIVAAMGQASTSALQRRLKLGYARAARIMDELEEMGIIGPSEGAKPRRVNITPNEAENYKIK